LLICPVPRSALLPTLPKEGNVAEIGVAEGDFSHQIVTINKPKKLFLIDPWMYQERDDYKLDPNNTDQKEQDKRYAAVCTRFADSIKEDKISVLRDFSFNAAKSFPDHFFDWVYIDAVHSYEGALQDLRTYYNKVSDDGLIVGHDFAKHDFAIEMNFGVVEAVETFVSETKCELLLITDEGYPTFVIAKNPTGDNAKKMLDLLLFSVPHIIEVEDWQGRFQQRLIKVGGKTRLVNGFRSTLR
tara:strand:- start:261 stop:986 length:726 start_codon:yes stop_codon:yes gene_type:complete